MYKYFVKNREDTSFPIKKYSQFDYIKNRYIKELNRVTKIYRDRERNVKNTHLLNRLIETISPDINLDIIDYLSIVTATSKNISTQFHITSTVSKGRAFNNLFYRANATEILLYEESNLDLEFIKNNFWKISPIKVIYSDDAELNYYIPYANKDLPFDSLFIYGIDVNLLLIQYRYWALDRINNGYGIDTSVFVGSIVIPNLAYGIFDFALFNRFLNISKGLPNPSTRNIHTFDIINFSSKVDEIYLKIFKDIKGDRIPLEFLLKAIPLVNHLNVYEMLKINAPFITTQIEWVIILSRIFIIYDLLNIMDKSGRSANSHLINDIPDMLRRINSRETSFYFLPEPIEVLFEDVKEKIKNTI